MELSSKLARQMAFKKKLDEEYRRRENKYIRIEDEIGQDNQKELDNCQQISKEEEERKKEAYQGKKDKWLKKREEYTARAAKFSELKKKRLDEKKKIEEPLEIFNDQDIWTELGNIIKDNQLALKDLENYKITVEIKEKEERIKQIKSKNADKHQDSWFVPLSELDFDIETKIGQGKFGSVYSGNFRKNISVAVKILRDKNGRKDKLVKDLLKEKKVMARLKHPNLVQMYAVSKDEEGNNILVQERMDNGSLLDYLKEIGPMENGEDFEETSFKSVLSWCVQVARGMAHLEKLKIVHRDLAARNVLLDENKRAKVADFGMAFFGKQSVDCDYLPVRWTAPEAIFDKQFSSASDVWSFGITMWEIFTFGEKPYKTLNIKEYKEKMGKDYEMKKNEFRCEQPCQLSKATEKEQKDVYNIMRKCWDINPTERPKFCDLEDNLHHFHLTGELIGYDTLMLY